MEEVLLEHVGFLEVNMPLSNRIPSPVFWNDPPIRCPNLKLAICLSDGLPFLWERDLIPRRPVNFAFKRVDDLSLASPAQNSATTTAQDGTPIANDAYCSIGHAGVPVSQLFSWSLLGSGADFFNTAS